MFDKMNCGIYTIVNTLNNKQYIGGSSNISRRWKEHRKNLKANKHHSIYLQNAYNKYGAENFRYKIILICSKEDLKMYEQIFLDFFKTYEEEFGYNIQKSVNSTYSMSEEQKEKLRKINTGRKDSEETRRKKSLVWKGRKHTQEAKDKVSKAQKGRIKSEKEIENLSKGYIGQKAWNKGQKMTDEYTESQQEKRMQTLRSNNTSISEYCKRGWETRRANKLKKQQELNQETIDNGTTGT